MSIPTNIKRCWQELTISVCFNCHNRLLVMHACCFSHQSFHVGSWTDFAILALKIAAQKKFLIWTPYETLCIHHTEVSDLDYVFVVLSIQLNK